MVILVVFLFFSGCSIFPRTNWGLRYGNYQENLIVGGYERNYILHVPPRMENDQELPLLIVLHGSYGSGRKMQRALGFDSYANERLFLVAYPDAYLPPGKNQTARWNDGRDTLISSTLEVDDVGFVTAMIEDIKTKVPIDDKKIFVTGASNGGMMAYRLGCETEALFAGIAPVIANIPLALDATCSPDNPFKVMVINGDADPFIPFEGGEVCENVKFGCEGGNVLSTEQSLKKFSENNGCRPDPILNTLPIIVDDGTYIEKWAFTDCFKSGEVIAYVVRNGGHTWPPHSGLLSDSGPSTANLDATTVIVQFFFP